MSLSAKYWLDLLSTFCTSWRQVVFLAAAGPRKTRLGEDAKAMPITLIFTLRLSASGALPARLAAALPVFAAAMRPAVRRTDHVSTNVLR